MTEHYLEKIAKLPVELQDILDENFDWTGRPRPGIGNPLSNVVISVLKKNSKAGGKEFMQDMKLMFPDMKEYEVATYYNVFLAGMDFLRDHLVKK
jgi:hypothetical protein